MTTELEADAVYTEINRLVTRERENSRRAWGAIRAVRKILGCDFGEEEVAARVVADRDAARKERDSWKAAHDTLRARLTELENKTDCKHRGATARRYLECDSCKTVLRHIGEIAETGATHACTNCSSLDAVLGGLGAETIHETARRVVRERDRALAREKELEEQLGSALELVNAGLDAPAATLEPAPLPMRLPCPTCGTLHVDEGENATRVHRTHACQSCGLLWAPAAVPTVGVQFLPGCKDEEPSVAALTEIERTAELIKETRDLVARAEQLRSGS